MHRQGPKKPHGKYFVFTGNTSWGVQNLEYDSSLNRWFLACYPGKKTTYSNYTLFCVDGAKEAVNKPLQGVEYQKKGAVLSLAEQGVVDPKNSAVRGWYNHLGVYGTHALGNGYFYLVSAGKDEKGRSATIHLARFTGNDDAPFELLK
jgi:hypothetical protein